MIKDFEEAIYYHSISHVMKENEEEKKIEEKVREKLQEKMQNPQSQQQPMYYSPMMYYPPYKDMEREMGRMYYGGQGGNSGSNSGGSGDSFSYASNGRGGNRSFYDGGYSMPMSDGGQPQSAMNYPNYAQEMRDYREGKSPMSRRSYMESKEKHHDKTKQMTELNKFLQELCDDVVEMLEGATADEKMIVSQKLTTLASKIK